MSANTYSPIHNSTSGISKAKSSPITFNGDNEEHVNDKRNLLKYFKANNIDGLKKIIDKYDCSISMNIEIDNNKNTLFHEAINKCNNNIIKIILNVSDSIKFFNNKNDNNGLNPLGIAVTHDFKGDCLESLLKYCKDNKQLNIKNIIEDTNNKKKATIFHMAADNNNIKCLEVLLKYKKEYDEEYKKEFNKNIINLQDEEGDIPIGRAIFRNHYYIVKKMLECDDIDIRKIDKQYNTVFHLVALNGNLSILKLLFQHIKSKREKEEKEKVKLILLIIIQILFINY
jgi:ankyrin repeat protein